MERRDREKDDKVFELLDEFGTGVMNDKKMEQKVKDNLKKKRKRRFMKNFTDPINLKRNLDRYRESNGYPQRPYHKMFPIKSLKAFKVKKVDDSWVRLAMASRKNTEDKRFVNSFKKCLKNMLIEEPDNTF